MVIGSLVTNIVADLSKWGPNLTKARGQMASFVKSVGTMQTAIAGLAGGAIVGFIRATIDQASALQDASVKLNINVEALQKYRYAVEQMGSSAGTLDTSLSFLNKTIGNAVLGNAKATAAFERLGLRANELAQIGLDAAFLRVVDALNGVPNESQRTSMSLAVLGKSSSSLTETIASGADALKKYGDELERIGGVASGRSVASLEGWGDRIAQIGRQLQTAAIETTADSGWLIEGAIDDIQHSLRIIGRLNPSNIWREMRGYTIPAPAQNRPPRLPTLPVNFPGNPARSFVNFPRNPALNPNFGQLPGQSPVAIDANQKDFMQGVTKTFNMLPGRIQGAIMQGMGAKLPAPVENFFEGIGRFVGGNPAGLAGAAVGGSFGGRFASSAFGPRVGPLEALSANSREGRIALTENLRPRGSDPNEKTARNTEKQVNKTDELINAVVNLPKSLAAAVGDVFDF